MTKPAEKHVPFGTTHTYNNITHIREYPPALGPNQSLKISFYLEFILSPSDFNIFQGGYGYLRDLTHEH